MTEHTLAQPAVQHRAALFTLCLIAGLAVFVFGVPYSDTFPTNGNLAYNIALTGLFLAVSLVSSRRPHWRAYAPLAYAFFIASFANLMQTIMPFQFLIAHDNGVRLLATDKVAQFLAIVISILVLTKLAGDSLGSIFLQRGNLLGGLIFGVVSFLLFALLAVGQNDLFGGRQSLLDVLRDHWYWILLWALANSFMEELWFRGIFLRKFTPFFGVAGAILLTALWFSISHIPATYIGDSMALIFGGIVFVLGVVGAYAMHKTDSVWGPMLLHAGYDLVIFVSVLESL